MSNPSKLIYVEGIIGAGKSTFVNNISSAIDCKIITEPVKKWQDSGILERYYSDMKRWALSFQLRIIHDKTQTLNAIPPNTGDIHIVERSIYSDKCFTNTLNHFGILDNFDYQLSNDIRDRYESMTTTLPDLIVYLRPSLETCMGRVKKRNRTEEKDLTFAYQGVLMDSHDAIFNKPELVTMCGKKVPILILEDNDITDELIQKIKAML